MWSEYSYTELLKQCVWTQNEVPDPFGIWCNVLYGFYYLFKILDFLNLETYLAQKIQDHEPEHIFSSNFIRKQLSIMYHCLENIYLIPWHFWISLLRRKLLSRVSAKNSEYQLHKGTENTLKHEKVTRGTSQNTRMWKDFHILFLTFRMDVMKWMNEKEWTHTYTYNKYMCIYFIHLMANLENRVRTIVYVSLYYALRLQEIIVVVPIKDIYCCRCNHTHIHAISTQCFIGHLLFLVSL